MTGTTSDDPQADRPRGDEVAEGDRRVPPYVALVRIGAVVGMSVFLAFGLFFFIGGLWMPGVISTLLSTPFFAVMRLAENLATPAGSPPDSQPR